MSFKTTELASVAHSALKANLPDLNVVLEYNAANSVCYGLYEKFSSTRRVGQILLRDDSENHVIFLDAGGNQIYYNLVLNIFSKSDKTSGQYKFFKNKSESLGVAIKSLYSKNSENLKTNFEAINEATVIEKAKSSKYTGKIGWFRGEFKEGLYFDTSRNIIFGNEYDPKLVDFYLSFCSKHKNANIMTSLSAKPIDFNAKDSILFTPNSKSIIFNTPDYTLLYFIDVKECYLLPAHGVSVDLQKLYGVNLPYRDLTIETNLIDIVDKLQDLEAKEKVSDDLNEKVVSGVRSPHLDNYVDGVSEEFLRKNSLFEEEKKANEFLKNKGMEVSVTSSMVYGPANIWQNIATSSYNNNVVSKFSVLATSQAINLPTNGQLTVPNFNNINTTDNVNYCYPGASSALNTYVSYTPVATGSYYPQYQITTGTTTATVSLPKFLIDTNNLLSPHGHTTGTITIGTPIKMDPQELEEALARRLQEKKNETPLTFKATAEKDAKSAAYRVAAKKTMKLLSVKLAEVVAVGMKLKGKQKGSFQERFSEFLLSEAGSSLFSLLLGTLLPQVKQHIPKNLERHVDRFAEECRVNGLAYMEETILDTITSSFSKLDISFFDSFSEKVRVVDDSTQSLKNSLPENLEEEEVLSNNQSSLATS